jgi:hypothetical protein
MSAAVKFQIQPGCLVIIKIRDDQGDPNDIAA